MTINIGKYEFTELWGGVLYKALSDPPRVTGNEMRDVIDFLDYEKANGRETEIVSDDPETLKYVLEGLKTPEKFRNARRPEIIRECTACPVRRGCMTDLVCHTAPPENAEKIFACGELRSAVNARGLPAETLMKEPRNAAGDPADFFHYVMFSWGNCQAGDRLVMERILGRAPTADELGAGFTPGVRFYFRYKDAEKLPGAVHDGFLPVKVRDRVDIGEALAVVIPEMHRERLGAIVPEKIRGKTYFLDDSGLDVWAWAEKVYSFAHELSERKF